MRIIDCTQKILRELGNPTLETPQPQSQEGLGNWYTNLLRIDGKKCFLFTNQKTLYSFLIPGVRKKNLKNIHDEFFINLNLYLPRTLWM
jgi:hypothetical protein